MAAYFTSTSTSIQAEIAQTDLIITHKLNNRKGTFAKNFKLNLCEQWKFIILSWKKQHGWQGWLRPKWRNLSGYTFSWWTIRRNIKHNVFLVVVSGVLLQSIWQICTYYVNTLKCDAEEFFLRRISSTYAGNDSKRNRVYGSNKASDSDSSPR